MEKSKLSSKYQMVVPKAIRKKMKLEAGVSLSIYPISETQALLVKGPIDYVEALSGLGKNVWKELGGADHYIKQERASWGDR